LGRLEEKKDEQRKKGTKTTFFRNNYQEQPNSKESRMTESLEKRPRKAPIKCWGCKGYHMYKDYPHRSERVKIGHNAQLAEIVEDMGKSVPKIYVALEKK
jgi:hypothetical protein